MGWIGDKITGLKKLLLGEAADPPPPSDTPATEADREQLLKDLGAPVDPDGRTDRLRKKP